MSATLATVDKILKEYYLGPVVEQLNNEVLLLSRLEARSEDLVGKAAFVPLHTGRSTGIGAVGENVPLPAAGAQKYDRAEYDLKYLYGRIRVTGPSMAKTKNDAGAFLQTLRGELDGIRADLSKDLARQVYGNGDAVIAAGAASSSNGGAATSQVLTLADWEPILKGHLYVGMLVDITTYSSGTPTIVASGAALTAVVQVGAANSTIAFTTSSLQILNGANVVRAGTVAGQNRFANGPRSNEIDGLQRIVDSVDATSSTFTSVAAKSVGKIDVFANEYWDNQRAAVGGDLTIMGIQKGLNLARQKAANPSILLTSLGVQREFYRLLQANQQFVQPGDTNYQAGFSTLMYAGMPVIADLDAPFGNLYILDESTLKVFSDQDWHFLDEDGQTLRQVAGYDAFEAIMARYANLGANNRAKNVVLTGIEVDGDPDAGY